MNLINNPILMIIEISSKRSKELYGYPFGSIMVEPIMLPNSSEYRIKSKNVPTGVKNIS